MCATKKSDPIWQEDSPIPGNRTESRDGTENLCPVSVGTRPYQEWGPGLKKKLKSDQIAEDKKSSR